MNSKCDEINELVLVCDFDGTLIDRDSETALIRWLAENRRLGLPQYLAALVSLPVNRVCRALGGHDLLRAWSALRMPEARNSLIDDFVRQEKEIRVDRRVADLVAAHRGRKLLLTGSNRYLAEALLVKFGLGGLFDEVIGGETGRGGFLLRQHPCGRGKLRWLPQDCAVGLGNSYGDRFYLDRCAKVYVVRPGERLLRLARENAWEIL